MQLYFLRHAQAEQRETWKGDDFDRPLTQKGKDRLARSAAKFSDLGVKPDAIITSPLKRAYSTARIAADQMDLASSLYKDDRLSPGFNLEKLAGILADHPNAQSVMLVGHEPDFSETIQALTGGRVVCKKGGLARVDLYPGASVADGEGSSLRGELLWLIPPKILAL